MPRRLREGCERAPRRSRHFGALLQALPRLFRASRTLASYVVPQEYGIEPEDKVTVGLQIAWQMLAKLLQDNAYSRSSGCLVMNC